MENTKDWDPNLYLKFRNERTQPSIDLVSKILPDFKPHRIIDIGCGPGNSSQVLVQRWPEASLLGIDSSANMIEKAKQDYPEQEWIIADAASYKSSDKFDLVFSNATIQWIPDHSKLLSGFHAMLSNKGILAIQIPLFFDMSVAKAIEHVANAAKWKAKTAGVKNLFTIHDKSFYYNVLSGLFSSIDMWETDYMHILESPSQILEMMRSTGLRPYMERLDTEADKEKFEDEILTEIKARYPLQKNGKVIFPFKRLFFIGYQ